jgi:putative transposase
MKRAPDPHHRHRFPAEIISHAVWLYHTFCLSFRDVELMLAERGIEVSYETIRRWCRKFAQTFANRLRRRRPRPGDRWHLDEVFIRINGVQHYLWRASSTCWAGAEIWASLPANGLVGLCGQLDAADVVPRLEGAGPLGAVVGSGHAVAGQKEEVVDLVVSG